MRSVCLVSQSSKPCHKMWFCAVLTFSPLWMHYHFLSQRHLSRADVRCHRGVKRRLKVCSHGVWYAKTHYNCDFIMYSCLRSYCWGRTKREGMKSAKCPRCGWRWVKIVPVFGLYPSVHTLICLSVSLMGTVQINNHYCECGSSAIFHQKSPGEMLRRQPATLKHCK